MYNCVEKYNVIAYFLDLNKSDFFLIIKNKKMAILKKLWTYVEQLITAYLLGV